MAKGFGMGGIGLLALGVAILLFGKRKTGTGSSATISSVVLSQEKGPGAPLHLAVTWTPRTLNAGGEPIPWNYRVDGRLIMDDEKEISANFVITRQAESGIEITTLLSGDTGPLFIPVRDLEELPQSYTLQVKVTIWAPQSDTSGQPAGHLAEMATGVSNQIEVHQDLSVRPSVVIRGVVIS